MLARHLRRRRVRAQALRHNLLLLLDRPTTPPLATRDQLDTRTPYARTISLMSVLSLHRRQQRRVHTTLPSRHNTMPQCVSATSLTRIRILTHEEVTSVRQVNTSCDDRVMVG